MYENLTVGRPTTHFSLEKKQFVDIIPPSKVIEKNVIQQIASFVK